MCGMWNTELNFDFWTILFLAHFQICTRLSASCMYKILFHEKNWSSHGSSGKL